MYVFTKQRVDIMSSRDALNSPTRDHPRHPNAKYPIKIHKWLESDGHLGCSRHPSSAWSMMWGRERGDISGGENSPLNVHDQQSGKGLRM